MAINKYLPRTKDEMVIHDLNTLLNYYNLSRKNGQQPPTEVVMQCIKMILDKEFDPRKKKDI